MTAPISDETLEDVFHNAFNENYYYQVSGANDNNPESPLFQPSPEMIKGIQAGIRAIRAALQEPVAVEDRARVYAEIRGAVFREGIAHDRRLEVWLVDPYGEHPAQVHMPLIPWLNKTQEGEADTP
jgi:hypothetical protein